MAEPTLFFGAQLFINFVVGPLGDVDNGEHLVTVSLASREAGVDAPIWQAPNVAGYPEAHRQPPERLSRTSTRHGPLLRIVDHQRREHCRRFTADI